MKKVYEAPQVKTELVMLGVFGGLFGSYGVKDGGDGHNEGGPKKRKHKNDRGNDDHGKHNGWDW